MPFIWKSNLMLQKEGAAATTLPRYIIIMKSNLASGLEPALRNRATQATRRILKEVLLPEEKKPSSFQLFFRAHNDTIHSVGYIKYVVSQFS